MKILILTAVAALIINISLIEKANANECWRIERQLNEANYKLRQGGDASYMKLWKKSRDHNARELPKCMKRFGDGAPQITVVKGSGSRGNNGYINEELRPINTNNTNLRRAIETCNFWINQHNQNGTEHDRLMRNNACKNAEDMERDLTSNNPPKEFTPVRTLKECRKPNNVMDNDVKLCMEGTIEPNWVIIEK